MTVDSEPRAGTVTASMAMSVCWFEDVLGAAVADRLFERVHELWWPLQCAAGGRDGESGVPGVARDFEGFPVPELAEALISLMPLAQTVLGVEVHRGTVRYSFTSHANGDSGGLRADAESGLPDQWVMSFAYFLHRRPRAFSGGQLRIYDTVVRQGRAVCASTFRDLQPDHDLLVFFPSVAPYEIRPVRCRSRRVVDGRFAIHGGIVPDD